MNPQTILIVLCVFTWIFFVAGTISSTVFFELTPDFFVTASLWQTCHTKAKLTPPSPDDCVKRDDFVCTAQRDVINVARAFSCLAVLALSFTLLISLVRRCMGKLEGTKIIFAFLVISFICALITFAAMIGDLTTKICPDFQQQATIKNNGVTFGPAPFLFIIGWLLNVGALIFENRISKVELDSYRGV